MSWQPTAPVARTAGLVQHNVKGEQLIHDEINGHFHQLNRTASAVWRLCDGTRDATAIAQASNVPVELVDLALCDFVAAGLLESAKEPTRLERRLFLKRASAVAAGLALPVIGSITSDSRTLAATCIPCGGTGCVADDDCCQFGPPGSNFTFFQCDVGNNPHDCFCA